MPANLPELAAYRAPIWPLQGLICWTKNGYCIAFIYGCSIEKDVLCDRSDGEGPF